MMVCVIFPKSPSAKYSMILVFRSKQEFSDDEDEEESSLEMAENRKKIRSGSQSIQDDSLKKEIVSSVIE